MQSLQFSLGTIQRRPGDIARRGRIPGESQIKMSIADYLPHGMIAAFAGIVTYVFKEHTTREDARFQELKVDLTAISDRQTQIADKMSANHAEILKVLLEAEQQRTANEVLAERRG
jgi:hypothetical protein